MKAISPPTPCRQHGSFLLEALIGIVIFTVGALALVALQANGIAAQNDAQYRIEAANMMDRLIGQIQMHVDRSSAAATTASVAALAHNPDGDTCNFSGDESADDDVLDWVDAASDPASATRLPGTSAATQQIKVSAGTFNQITVTQCWKMPTDTVMRQHTIIAYIN